MVRNSDQIEDLRRGMCGKFMILSVFTEIIRVKSRRVLEGLETQSFDSLEPDSLPTSYQPIQPISLHTSSLISDTDFPAYSDTLRTSVTVTRLSL